MYKQFLMFLCLCTLIASEAEAQTPESNYRIKVITTIIKDVKRGARLRIKDSASNMIEGKFIERKRDEILIRKDQTNRAVSLDSIQAIWIQRSATGSGAKVGAIAVGIMGTLSGLAVHGLCQGLDESEDPEGCPEFIAAGAFLGATGGALIGAGIGSLARNWHQIYPQ
ncbi:hypothetical protein GWO43_02225 [candidate division KSB1 bacterium]|nr:hypothetical protein [candidate division KSB1 bacterium]NIR69658.1 hypothetical protein [candidate division KSB1 bacterium]NIS22887.1 hypothetical protein [candidate division KSB1 bacterium]NIT69726.1 hypothetical protein [candidate division KSB1 bacterium]NIU23393.1 hypothetical protein [candidate division KSB1 bacterium]